MATANRTGGMWLCRGLTFQVAALFLTFLLAMYAFADSPTNLRGMLVSADQVTSERLAHAKTAGHNTVILLTTAKTDDAIAREARAAETIRANGLAIGYWLEVARDPELADAHPEWMASLQGHQQWRRFHPDFPDVSESSGVVVKNYPWVPILYKEAFDAHLQRVRSLLSERSRPDLIFLNDLQGAPSACGCGNTLCRWTADYGPIKTATALEDDAAARFVKEVGRLAAGSRIIPVWVTECEQHDGSDHGACAGVGCFEGICWRAYTRQLMPVAAVAERIAVLLPVRDFQRELPAFKRPAGWTAHALRTFQTLPPQRGGEPISPDRLIAVLQGWEIEEAIIRAQVKRAVEAGVSDYIIARTKIEQSWEPKLFKR